MCVWVCVIFHVIKFFNHEESIRRFAEREWRSVLVFSFTLSDLARFAWLTDCITCAPLCICVSCVSIYPSASIYWSNDIRSCNWKGTSYILTLAWWFTICDSIEQKESLLPFLSLLLLLLWHRRCSLRTLQIYSAFAWRDVSGVVGVFARAIEKICEYFAGGRNCRRENNDKQNENESKSKRSPWHHNSSSIRGTEHQKLSSTRQFCALSSFFA